MRTRRIYYSIHRELMILLVIIGISVFLRLWNIEGYPRWYCDEGTNAHLGLNMLEGVIGYKTWGPNFFPPLFDFIQGITVRLLGRTYFAVRLPSVIFGVLSIIVLWFIAKNVLNNIYWTALACVLFSLASMHINRMGLQHNAGTFFVLLTTYLLTVEKSTSMRWFLAGLSVSLAFLSHYTGGAIAGIFIILLSVLKRRPKAIFIAISGASIPLLSFVIVGFLASPQWFIYDLLYQAGRKFNSLEFLGYLFVATPFGWEFRYPFGEAPPIIYGFTLVGALSSIYILFTAKQRASELIALIMASVIGLLLSKDIWWAFILYLQPAYSLAFVVLLRECYQERKIAAMMLLLVPAIIQLITLQGILDTGIYYSFLITLLSSLFAYLASETAKKYIYVIIKLAKALLAIAIILYVIVLPLSLDIPLLSIDSNTDKKSVLKLLSSTTENGDLVAVSSEFLPLISDNVEGVDVAHLTFCYAKMPQFLYEDVDTYLKRFRPKYCDPRNYGVILFTWDHGLPIKEVTGGVLIDYLTEQWPSTLIGRHLVFVNPLKIINASFVENKLIVPLINVTYAYSLSVKQHKFGIEDGKLSLEAVPGGPYGWVFWRITFPEPFVVSGDLLVIAKFNASTNLVRFVIKPLDIKGNEALPWITGYAGNELSTWAYRFYNIGNNSFTLGGIIIGFDWNDPNITNLALMNEVIKVNIEYVVLISGISSKLAQTSMK